ncbi:hypothetical protein KAT59_09435, partial [Candidatus Bipolaricaulota bacterium]|nr:hypothetical protein [Candidatus Bipolaricaulota bacterium]
MALRQTTASRGKSRGGKAGVAVLAALVLLVFAGGVTAQTIEIIKDIYVDEPLIWSDSYLSQWVYDISGPTPHSETIGGDESTGALSVSAGTYTIVESPGAGFLASDYTTTWEYTVNGAPGGSGTGTTLSGLSV